MGYCKHTREGEKGKELISHEPSVNKGWKGRRADSASVISHCLK
jgi:hypothetical protein